MLGSARLGLAIAKAGADSLLKAEKRTLYVHRKLQPADAGKLVAWAKANGFPSTLDPADMHVTITFSRMPVDWIDMGSSWEQTVEVPAGGPRLLEHFEGGAIVLLFASGELEWRHQAMIDRGASWDFPDYQPHVTIAYDREFSIEGIEAYQGKLTFGPEFFAEVDEDWKDKVVSA